MTAGHWQAWAEGLTIYYHNPPSGTTLSNHIFDFCDSTSSNIYKPKEYHGAEAVEFGLHPTSKIRKDSVGLTAKERAEGLSIIPPNLTSLKAPGLSTLHQESIQILIQNTPLCPNRGGE